MTKTCFAGVGLAILCNYTLERPHPWGWKVFEMPGVEPVFGTKDQALNYAQTRACFRSGEIRVKNLAGNVESAIPFSEAERRL